MTCALTAQRLRGAVIRVGNSDVIANNEKCGETITADEISSNEMIEVECALEGRFVSVQLENITGVLTLCEVEVLGEVSTSAEQTTSQGTESPKTTTGINTTEHTPFNQLTQSSTTVEYTTNEATTQVISSTTVERITTKFPSSEVTTEATPSATSGSSPTRDEISTSAEQTTSQGTESPKTTTGINTTEHTPFNQLTQSSTTVESTTNEATSQEISSTTVERITTKFPSSEVTTEATPSATSGSSPTSDEISTSAEQTTSQGTESPKTTTGINTTEHTPLNQLTQLCTKRIGKHIISINSKSSLIAVGRSGFRSNSSNHLLTCSDGIWSTGFPRYTNINECDEDKNICSPQLTNQECIDNIGSYRCVCQQGFVSLGSKLCVPLFLMEKKCNIGAFETSKTCPAGSDTLTKIYWESVPANCSSDWVNCPDGYTGKMMRFCDERGEWWEPYTTECKSEEILHMIEQVPDLSLASRTAGLLTNITLSMDKAYAGNLLLAKYMLSEILDNDPLSSPGSEDDKTIYLQSIVRFMSALLDADTEPSWIQIHETRGVHLGAMALFATLNRFGETVHRYVRQVDTEIRLYSKNIGIKIFQFSGSTVVDCDICQIILYTSIY
ncbi:uncharacterized protein [Ptychodera flava]|uniref:uncharacterized protein n=1 Tax=Ptychodera flava TaxID=63121 RepID=UPI00396A6D93